MGHARAKLTPFGRLLVIQRVHLLGWSVSAAAASVGISRPTAYKWLRRYQTEGTGGLEDRPSRPQTSPRSLPPHQEARILAARQQLRMGPHRLSALLGVPRSTISKVLTRHRLSRLRDLDRASGVPIRYVRDHPGELVHVDMKPLGRVPAGGGHRVWGRAAATPRTRGAGYATLHVAVDDASRLAFAQLLADGRGATAARFLLEAAAFFAAHGLRIERVLTDGGWAYTASRTFQRATDHLGIRHKVTRPYRPQTNGKAERFIRTALQEWAYARLYRSDEERRAALPKWLHYYNHQRPHTALGSLPPIARV